MKRGVVLVLFLSACNGESEPPGITYYQDVAPILHYNCSGCHRETGLNPVVLFDDYESAVTYAGWIEGEVQDQTMPPFYASETDECPNPWGFLHDPRLSESDKQTISDWVSQGTPEGDPANPAPLTDPLSYDLEGAVTYMPPVVYTTPPFSEVQDQFVCVSVDPGLSETGWLEAFQVLPGNSEVVHHVLTGIGPDPSGSVTVNPDGTYPCFGGFGIADVEFIGGWVPGAAPTTLPAFSAIAVDPGEHLFLQIHYHMAETEQTDTTGLAVRWATEQPVRQATVSLTGNASKEEHGLQPGPNDSSEGAQFLIPPNVSDHTETMKFTWYGGVRNAQVFMAANHMHYVGKDMRVWTEGSDQCLLQTPNWDFDWQQFYAYDATRGNAPTIRPGDELWLQCTYDNSLANPQLVSALKEAGLDEPVPVTIGEGSLDEMCLVLLGVVPEMDLDVDNSNFVGTLTSTVAVPLDGNIIEFDCNGPAHLDRTGDTFQGIAACGAYLDGYLYTSEFTLEGTISGADVSGSATMRVVNVWDGDVAGPGTFTGTVDSDGTLQLTVDTIVSPAGFPITWVGSMEISPTETD